MAYEEDGAGLIVCALNVTISSTKSGPSPDGQWKRGWSEETWWTTIERETRNTAQLQMEAAWQTGNQQN